MMDQDGAAQPIEPIRVLLSQIIDYAGLFPPSQASMSEAVLNFATYRNSNYGWMLGRFVVPAARLDEFLEVARDFVSRDGDPWRLAVVAGENINETLRQVTTFNEENGPSIVCDVLEVKANTVSKIENTVKAMPEGITAYFEIATGDAFVDLITSLATLEQRAKLRTGGVSHDDFPTSREIIRFVRTCMAANVPFKATAGLHHPIRGDYALTYAEDSARGTMFGFLNVFLAAAFLGAGVSESTIIELLEERGADAIRFDDDGVSWRGHRLTREQLLGSRRVAITSFGSCSFREPLDDLVSLGLL